MQIRKKTPIILVLIIIVLILIISFIYMFRTTQQQGNQDAISNNMSVVGGIQTNIENVLENNFEALELLAKYPDIQAFDPSILDPILDDAASIYTNIKPIGISDDSGMQIAKSNGAIKVDIQDREHFTAPMNGEDRYISNILTSKADGSYICMMAVPIMDSASSQANGVIVGTLDLSVFDDFINSLEIVNSEVVVEYTDSFIVDNEGFLLAHPSIEFAIGEERPDYSDYEFVKDGLNNNSNTMIYENESGETILVSYVVEQKTGWVICTEVPLRVAQRELIRRLVELSLIYLVLIVILILIIIMLSLNIRKRQAAEYSLALMNDSLEEKVKKRGIELEETMKELMDRERLASLGSLVAGVSHEINTPLGVAITAGTYIEKKTQVVYDLMSEGRFSKTSLIEYMEKMDESTGIINNNLGRAAELIKSFKNLAVNQSVQEIITFNLKTYIDSIVFAMKHEYKNRPITIDNNIDKGIEITSYSSDFAQIMTNFLMNSLRHGFEPEDVGHISISGHIENQWLTLVYSDDGVGIDQAIIHKIYEPFFTSNRNADNSGLGMNIIYNIVKDRLGGSIQCESTLGEGTVFTIRVPSITRSEVKK